MRLSPKGGALVLGGFGKLPVLSRLAGVFEIPPRLKLFGGLVWLGALEPPAAIPSGGAPGQKNSEVRSIPSKLSLLCYW